ncbi:uncharacterized protein RSE6_00889 [Rhynchosporium secalis]|uniref:Uncharacterized protein n=1 Tax=Rhynchosporium secalis TaxID=38038 RepID=A0A1E1LWE7_RHYSE|nr:uncharacterized protein RSE6_00889 [Rhynchosporium secalis]
MEGLPDDCHEPRAEGDYVTVDVKGQRPAKYPRVGSSIGLSRDHEDIKAGGSGTLGGFIKVDGKVYGLSTHDNLLGKVRREAYPTQAEESVGRDLYAWVGAKSQLGTVWKSSGIRVGSKTTTAHHHRINWALIHLENPTRFTDPDLFVNKLPYFRRIRFTTYVKDAMTLGLQSNKDIEDMPRYLKRSLTTEEFKHRQGLVEKENKQQVVWKYGRSTECTYGVSSYIELSFRDVDGTVSDEWLVLDTPLYNYNHQRQSSYGLDTGSFVWDPDGFVVGMLWRGRESAHQSYVTPIEAVLEDIKRVCGAEKVELVVRQEELGSPAETPC